MRLRGRFTLWFALAAILPITLASIVTREVLSTSYRGDYQNMRAGAERATTLALREEESRVERLATVLANPEQEMLSRLFLAWERNNGNLSVVDRREISRIAGEMLRVFDLDVLFILDGEGRVLAAPHNRAAQDTREPELVERTKASMGKAYYSHDAVIRGDTMDEALVVQAARSAREGGRSVSVLVGAELDNAWASRLRRPERVDLRVSKQNGSLLVPASESWGQFDGPSSIQLPLLSLQGELEAKVSVVINDVELSQVLANVTMAAAVLGVGAVLFTVILGLFVARRMTRDLDELVLGAQAIAKDQYDHQVIVSSRDEIGELADAFNLMTSDLRESKERLAMAERIAAWQEIARRLAHEIKNPLTPIQMSVESMRKAHNTKHDSFEEIFEESTTAILEETQRLKRIVSEFSEFARMPEARKVKCDLNEVVGAAATLYRGALVVEEKLSDGLPPVWADRDQLTQVVLNLVENARDAIASAGTKAGRIELRTRGVLDGLAVELVVSDNGPGIAADAREKIFTPYFTTKMTSGGTGLGLATVHRIVSEHGGRIRVGESDWGGAAFVVALPVGREPLALTHRSVPPKG